MPALKSVGAELRLRSVGQRARKTDCGDLSATAGGIGAFATSVPLARSATVQKLPGLAACGATLVLSISSWILAARVPKGALDSCQVSILPTRPSSREGPKELKLPKSIGVIA